MNDTKPKENRKVLKIIPVVFLVLSLALGVFRSFLLFTDIDTANGLYTDTHLGSLFGTCAMVLFVAALLAGFVARRFDYARPIKNESISVAFASTICALMMVVIFFGDIFDMVVGRRPISILLCAETVLCVPTILYFFVICSKGAKTDITKPATYSLLPLFPALYAAMRTITLFIDKETQINASQRTFVLLTMICIMMFFVTEAEFAIPRLCQDKENEKKTMRGIAAKYYALGIAVSSLVLVIIVTYAFAQAFWLFTDESLLYNIMDVCFGLYALIRVFSI